MDSGSGKLNTAKAGEADGRRALLGEVPSVDECLHAVESLPELGRFSRQYLRALVRRATETLRSRLAKDPEEVPRGRAALLEEAIDLVRRAAEADKPPLLRVVNATGVVLHTNLGRALLPEAAVEAAAQAARFPVNLEYDLEAGGRGERDSIVEAELCALTGAGAATVVNNNAAAVLLALNSLAEGREVIVSRGELIEIGGSFRLPEVMAKSGARLVEVGTTNRTHRGDYERAIGAATALLFKVHPSNYRVVGFTAEVSLAELVALGRERGVEVMEDLGSGALIDLAAYGLPREPVVAEQVAAGAGLVTFSADKLLGGPQAGVVVGRRELVARLKSNPLKRALRLDKLTLAALSATLRLYARSPALEAEIPTLRFLCRSVDELERMAARAREVLRSRLDREFEIEIVPAASQIGSGSLPTEELETRALAVRHARLSPAAVAALFRRASPPVIGRVKDDVFLLDLRTVGSADELAVVFAAP